MKLTRHTTRFGVTGNLLAPIVLLVALLHPTMPAWAGDDRERSVSIGVLAPMGNEHALQRWQPTADYLSEQIAGHRFRIVPASKEELTKAVELEKVDFFLTNTGHYVEIESMFRATRILTLKQVWNNRVYSQWGSLIFTLGDNETVNDLRDIKGKRIAAVYPGAFAGFQVAFRELVELKILSHKDKRDILFTGLPHSSPLEAVLREEAEVGIIPTGVLEEQIHSGAHEADSFKVINGHLAEQFPFQVSTRLYPLWPLAKTRHASEKLAEEVVAALLSLREGHDALTSGRVAGWTVPLDYSDIHNLMREIRVGPYKDYGRISFGQLVHQYRIWLVFAFLLFLTSWLVIVHISKLNARLSDARIDLEVKVEERTRDLEDANRQLSTQIQKRDLLFDDLVAAKESLSKAQEMSHLGNWKWNILDQSIEWSDEVFRIFGIEVGSIATTYDNFMNYVHPDDRNAVTRAIKASVSDPEIPYALEHRIIHDDGTQRYVHEQGEVVWDADGSAVQMLGTVQDITEHKRIELQLERAVADKEILGMLLHASLRLMPLQEYLETMLNLLIGQVAWLRSTSQVAVFMVDATAKDQRLELVSSVGFSRERRQECALVPFGKCLCGKAASSRSITYSGCVDERHDILPKDLDPHGHYCVPIEKEETLLGVLMLRLHEGHQADANEQQFLKRVADIFSMGIARNQAESEIEYYAYHDTLTGLPNRRLLLDRLSQEVFQAERSGKFGAVFYLDLDNFKNLNDSLGHPIGDSLLLQVAERLSSSLRKDDTIARIGGDEFVILLPSLSTQIDTAASMAGDKAEQIRLLLHEPYLLEGHEYHTSVSLGITLFPKDRGTMDDYLKQADSALYEAKRSGRDTLFFYHRSMQEAAIQRLSLERDVRLAIGEGEFYLHFQPQVDKDGKLVGAEALIRWQQPKRGPVSPGAFIPVAEESGLIVPLGRQVLDMACKFLQSNDRSGKLASLSVNISPKQFKQPTFVDDVKDSIERYGIDPGKLVLEITESVLLENVESVMAKMEELKALSIRFSIDDFGTGYSSMTYLKNLPVDELKIDQSFVRNVPGSASDAAIIEAILSMSRPFGLTVVAEGVETREQHEFLKEAGCELFQGYHFDRPLSERAFCEKYGLTASRPRQS